MLTLALDTSLKNITLAIIKGQRILAAHNSVPEQSQSTVIMRVIDDIFKQAKLSVSDINTVLFCNGPGSFTSLRVGLATVQGLFLKSGVRFLVTSSLLFRCLSLSDQSDMSDKSDKLGWSKLPLGRDRLAVGFFAERSEDEPRRSSRRRVALWRSGVSEGGSTLLCKLPKGIFKQRTPSCPNYYEGFLSGDPLAEMNKLFPALSNIVPDDVSCTDPEAFLTILEKKWFEETPLAEARLFYMIEPDVGTPRTV